MHNFCIKRGVPLNDEIIVPDDPDDLDNQTEDPTPCGRLAASLEKRKEIVDNRVEHHNIY